MASLAYNYSHTHTHTYKHTRTHVHTHANRPSRRCIDSYCIGTRSVPVLFVGGRGAFERPLNGGGQDVGVRHGRWCRKESGVWSNLVGSSWMYFNN